MLYLTAVDRRANRKITNSLLLTNTTRAQRLASKPVFLEFDYFIHFLFIYLLLLRDESVGSDTKKTLFHVFVPFFCELRTYDAGNNWNRHCLIFKLFNTCLSSFALCSVFFCNVVIIYVNRIQVLILKLLQSNHNTKSVKLELCEKINEKKRESFIWPSWKESYSWTDSEPQQSKMNYFVAAVLISALSLEALVYVSISWIMLKTSFFISLIAYFNFSRIELYELKYF